MAAESMFACACSCDWDHEPADPYSESEPRARKEHTCCECRGIITPGEHYQLAKGKWDGDWQSYRTCAFCVAVRTDHCGGCWTFTTLWEDLLECYREDWKEGGETLEETKAWLLPESLKRERDQRDGDS